MTRRPGHAGLVSALAFSPDGPTLASGSGEATGRLWATAPLKAGHRARREAETLRIDADRLVGELLRAKQDAAGVAAASGRTGR